MEFNFASRLDSFEEGIFATLNDKKNELVKAGREGLQYVCRYTGFQTGPSILWMQSVKLLKA